MWCSQNGSVSSHWFVPARFRNYFARAAQLFYEPTRQIWDAQLTISSNGLGTIPAAQMGPQEKCEPINIAVDNRGLRACEGSVGGGGDRGARYGTARRIACCPRSNRGRMNLGQIRQFAESLDLLKM
jgi:hypothetical protein